MKWNRIISGFSVLTLAVGLVCLNGLAGTPAFAAGSYKVLHSFQTATDGTSPYGSLIFSGGNLYGTAIGGGTGGQGTIFQFNVKTSQLTVLHAFAGGTTDGANPYGGLVLSGKNLYGMTSGGGTGGAGTIFEYNIKTKQFTILHSFAGGAADGANPLGSLILSGTNLYGMTLGGGSTGYGTIFEYNIKTNQFVLLHNFQGKPNDGTSPMYGNLIFSKGNLYGMTVSGGAYGSGAIFQFTVKTSQLSLLYSFWGGDGDTPMGGLVLSGQNLYGMAVTGSEGGGGLVFMLNIKNSEFTILHSFEGATADGASPFGTPTLSGKNLYGMTVAGGTSDYGTIFTFNSGTGAYSVLHSFTGTTSTPADGERPYGNLILSGTTLYGVTSAGGDNTDGVIFSYSLK